MCGIAGLVVSMGSAAGIADSAPFLLEKFADSIAHRGPDSGGVWFDSETGVGFAHRRLSIVDLSPEGAQPMHSSSGRYTITYNGEIYNFSELRSELIALGVAFRGTSDTEVLLAGIEQWGIENTITRCNGMFAFGLWDARDRVLHLVRDRVGVKPLYYGWIGGCFVFGSELKPFFLIKEGKREVDRVSLSVFMRYNYVTAPLCIFKGVFKLPQASILSLPLSDLANKPSSFSPYADSSNGARSPIPYWQLRDHVEAGLHRPFVGSEEELVRETAAIIEDSVRLRMRADVPVGAFLSSGLDSSTVVALMQRSSARPVKTFTIGVEDEAQNEAHVARRIAKHLGTEHHELYASAELALEVIPKLPGMYDEPFADFSQIPTYLVSQLARSQVTVSLSGDGGDELFGGYHRYLWTSKVWDKLQLVPNILRRGTRCGLGLLSEAQWDSFYRKLQPFLPSRYQFSLFGHKMHKLARVIDSSDPAYLYDQMLSQWEPSDVVIDGYELRVAKNDPSRWVEGASLLQFMMYLDTMSYLPDDIMVKLDRASMSVGLEAREPLLDYRLIEFVSRVPDRFKIRGGVKKWLLRAVARDLVPAELLNLPKRGFSVPLDQWLRGALRDWAEALLAPERLAAEGYFSVELVRAKWEEHLSGRGNWQYPLWNILVFQSWLEKWRQEVTTPPFGKV